MCPETCFDYIVSIKSSGTARISGNPHIVSRLIDHGDASVKTGVSLDLAVAVPYHNQLDQCQAAPLSTIHDCSTQAFDGRAPSQYSSGRPVI